MEAKKAQGASLFFITTQVDVRPKLLRQGRGKNRVELAAVGGMSGGASSSSSSRSVGSEVSNASTVDMDEFPVLEWSPCFDKGRLGRPPVVSLNRVLLASGEALSLFAYNLHFMREKLHPCMDFAVGADAEVADRFSFRDA